MKGRRPIHTERKPIKILLTGPESSGKTIMARWCARKYAGQLIPEYARYYLAGTDGYGKEDVFRMLKAQMQMESDLTNYGFNLIVADTSILVYDIWLEEKFGSSTVDAGFQLNHLEGFNLIFLCKPDFPWEFDALRENPYDRDRLFNIYKSKLEYLNCSFSILSGDLKERQSIMADKISVLLPS